jgi:hypothetical protein
VDDWYERLKATVAHFEGKPWAWGRTDCAVFAAASVEAVTGQDVLGAFRGAYSSPLTAAGRLRGHGFKSVREAAAKALMDIGATEIDPRFAQVGDIGVTRDDVLAVRVLIGFVARRPDGSFGKANVVAAWAVGWE